MSGDRPATGDAGRVDLPAAISSRNILVIQTGFVGDMVLTTPLLRSLRKNAPGARITLLHSPRCEGIVRCSRRIDHRIVYRKNGPDRGIGSLLRLCARLKRGGYDLVISPHRSFRSGMLALSTGARRRIGFARPPSGLFYTDTVPYSRWESTFIRRKLTLLEPLGIEEEDETPELTWDDTEEKKARELLGTAPKGAPIALFAVGAAWPTKCWPAESFRDLARLLGEKGWTAVAVGAGGDRSAGALAAEGGALDFTGRTSLETVAALLGRATLFVGGDSGLLHMARALRVPSVALFGPTGPEQFRFEPFVRVIRSGAHCAPCSDHGARECPERDWICMPGIEAKRVFDAAMGLLERIGAATR